MNRNLRCLIVDDEPLARDSIRMMVEKDRELQIIGECSNGLEALKAIREQNPDVVFLDIQMPQLDGFGVVKGLKNQTLPYIIFVTAYDQYAVRAFDVHALDYLLKPLDEERFERATERAKTNLQSQSEWAQQITSFLDEVENRDSQYLDRLMIKEDGRIFLLNVADVDWIEAKGNYLLIHSGKKSHLMREAMAAMETKLDPNKFFRIHRSTIVNIDRIFELQSLYHGDSRIILQDGTKLLMSRRFRDKLKSHLSI